LPAVSRNASMHSCTREFPRRQDNPGSDPRRGPHAANHEGRPTTAGSSVQLVFALVSASSGRNPAGNQAACAGRLSA
jgi:hypothetical protein